MEYSVYLVRIKWETDNDVAAAAAAAVAAKQSYVCTWSRRPQQLKTRIYIALFVCIYVENESHTVEKNKKIKFKSILSSTVWPLYTQRVCINKYIKLWANNMSNKTVNQNVTRLKWRFIFAFATRHFSPLHTIGDGGDGERNEKLILCSLRTTYTIFN